jgi:predicted metal-dependent peptidase
MSPELAKKLGGVGYKPGDKEINWKRVLVEASTHAKMMGKLPGGIEGLVDAELEPPKFHWKELLWQYISRCVPQDFTYSRPSKKSRAAGFFMPSVTREHIDITVWFDTSGSISDDEYVTFISELYMIARSFESINITVGLCDAKVQSVLNGQGPYQIIEAVRNRKGYGGTDFRPGIEWTIQNQPSARLVIYFTDGWGTFPDTPPPFNVLWVFTANSADPDDAPFGQVIKIED